MTLDAPQVFTLHPGDVAVGLRGDRLETLLGSCVAIILTDPRRTVGAMCHVVHSGRHAEAALLRMAEGLMSHGIVPRLCEAYVYGGGNMFPQFEDTLAVGDGNAAWAVEALAELGASVLDVDVRGHVYRRLRWTVGPGAPQVECVHL